MIRTTCIALLFSATMLFIFNGCSGKTEPPTGELFGKVLSNDDLVSDCVVAIYSPCLLYTSPSPRDRTRSRMPSSA